MSEKRKVESDEAGGVSRFSFPVFTFHFPLVFPTTDNR